MCTSGNIFLFHFIRMCYYLFKDPAYVTCQYFNKHINPTGLVIKVGISNNMQSSKKGLMCFSCQRIKHIIYLCDRGKSLFIYYYFFSEEIK